MGMWEFRAEFSRCDLSPRPETTKLFEPASLPPQHVRELSARDFKSQRKRG